MIDCTTQAQSGDDDMGGDNVAVSMEESKMDDFFQEVVMVMMMMMSMRMVVMVMTMMAMRMVMTMMMVLMMDTVHGGEQDGRLLPRGDDDVMVMMIISMRMAIRRILMVMNNLNNRTM